MATQNDAYFVIKLRKNPVITIHTFLSHPVCAAKCQYSHKDARHIRTLYKTFAVPNSISKAHMLGWHVREKIRSLHNLVKF